MRFIDVPTFIIAFAIGLFFVYISAPKNRPYSFIRRLTTTKTLFIRIVLECASHLNMLKQKNQLTRVF